MADIKNTLDTIANECRIEAIRLVSETGIEPTVVIYINREFYKGLNERARRCSYVINHGERAPMTIAGFKFYVVDDELHPMYNIVNVLN